MPSSSSAISTIFYGAVINPTSLRTYSALPRCLLAVDATGDIDWVVEDVEPHSLQETLASKGYIDAQVVPLKEGQFIIPGFIDTHTVTSTLLSTRDRISNAYLYLARTSSSEYGNVSWIPVCMQRGNIN